ncbi:histidinol dehydrogenase [Microbacterium sp.]|uniref:histidinol dehydrogenase n=1 Tax=Microbacterium sp. TaxID=51671 RepID=UPI0039E384F5
MGITAARVVTWLLALVVGTVYGVAGTIGHAARWGVLPVGLVVALVGVGALVIAMRLLTDDRGAALATGVGVVVAAALFSGRGPGGSIVVPAADQGEMPWGLVWTIAVPLIVLAVVLWPSPRRRAVG